MTSLYPALFSLDTGDALCDASVTGALEPSLCWYAATVLPVCIAPKSKWRSASVELDVARPLTPSAACALRRGHN